MEIILLPLPNKYIINLKYSPSGQHVDGLCWQLFLSSKNINNETMKIDYTNIHYTMWRR
jgi:hypothetical protein